MARDVYEIDDYNLDTSGATKPAPLMRKGPISIQPVLTGLVGNPTYTVQVSNDGVNFVDYHKRATNVAIDDFIWIAYDEIPFIYMRMEITRSGSDAGNVRFKLGIKDA